MGGPPMAIGGLWGLMCPWVLLAWAGLSCYLSLGLSLRFVPGFKARTCRRPARRRTWGRRRWQSQTDRRNPLRPTASNSPGVPGEGKRGDMRSPWLHPLSNEQMKKIFIGYGYDDEERRSLECHGRFRCYGTWLRR